MHIRFVEIQNFRKLKSVRIEFATDKTLFVGANNSGKTSAMLALRYFLVKKDCFHINDFTLSNMVSIDNIGNAWENSSRNQKPANLALTKWTSLLPSMDVWMKVEKNEVHHVIHLLPSLEWKENELLGVRLRLEPRNMEALYKEYVETKAAANDTQAKANKDSKIVLWPTSLSDFFRKRLKSQFEIHSYLLDPTKLAEPKDNHAVPQELPEQVSCITDDPFRGLIKIDEINAQRGFSDEVENDDEAGEQRYKRTLSGQLRAYYDKHIDPSEIVEPSDIKALEAIHQAQAEFDARLEDGFKDALKELRELGYPRVTDPTLIIATKIKPMDGLNHTSALQYEVISKKDAISQEVTQRLPEEYNGLGYRNLISMVFKLMSFRDSWMQVGKLGKVRSIEANDEVIPPLHLVLIEEPEAHLHAQVQQVFIRKAYDILRKHVNLENNDKLTTQLIVSTHSSHIVHECNFDSLRYFRRLPAVKNGEVPTSVVINLSTVFGSKDDTQKFAIRYLKTTHCDLFFADAAILVEGPAERMLVPHFIREHFTDLSKCYISLLEIGGSHAHRLRPLIEKLGLITLIITDLDATKNCSAIPPKRGDEQVTRNATLKEWVPGKEKIDELLDINIEGKIKKYDNYHSVCVSYQCPVSITYKDLKDKMEVLPYTFEDALVFENVSIFAAINGSGLVKKFKSLIEEKDSLSDLGEAMFQALKSAEKAKFALDLLYSEEPKKLKVPAYIENGLNWLQEQLEARKYEIAYQDKTTRIIKEERK